MLNKHKQTLTQKVRSSPPTWSLHSLVVVRVYTYFILFKIKSIFTVFNCLKFMVAVQVWPAPQAAVNDVGQSLAVRHLQAAIEGPAGERCGEAFTDCALPRSLQQQSTHMGSSFSEFRALTLLVTSIP